MTRKRFIKLAMSCGVQRNEVALIASLISVYGSYTNLMRAYSMRFSATKATNAIKKAACSIAKKLYHFFCNNLYNSASKFSQERGNI